MNSAEPITETGYAVALEERLDLPPQKPETVNVAVEWSETNKAAIAGHPIAIPPASPSG